MVEGFHSGRKNMTILAIALKDLTRSFRSAFAIGMMVVAPLLLTGVIYLAFGGMSGGDTALTPISVGVVDADRLPAGSVLEAPLGENIRSMFFDESVASWISAADYPDPVSAREAVDAGEIGVAVIVPENFTQRYLSGDRDVQVLIVSDPTLSIGPSVVEDMVTMMIDGAAGGGIAIETIAARLAAGGVEPDPAQYGVWAERFGVWYAGFQRDLFHHPETAALILAAPSAEEGEVVDPFRTMIALTITGQMIFFAFFTGANAMMSILREREEGTLARLFTTPVSRTTILAGKFLAVVITVIVQGLVMLTAGHFLFGVNWGDPLPVSLALLAQVIAASGLGVLLIAFVRTTRQGGPVLGGGLTVLGMLGGLFTANLPNEMPAAFTAMSKFTPQGWVLEAWNIVLSGGPVLEMMLPFTVSLLLGAGMFALGATLFRRRFA
jgi:ABC-2 type transport system permease protein